MYKLLLCLRYLRTRYIALASIISVTLGVATMIVVNSVMAGFGTEMRERIHGLLADVIIETISMDGVSDPAALIARAQEVAGDDIAGMTATVEVYGMLSFRYGGEYVTRPVTIIGIDPAGKAQVGPLVDYLDSYNPRVEDGKVARPPLRSRKEPIGWSLTHEARKRRADWADLQRSMASWAHGAPAAAPVVTAPADATPVNTAAATAAPVFESTDDASAEPPVFEDDRTVVQTSATRTAPPQFFPVEERLPVINPEDPLPGRIYVGIGLVSYPNVDPVTGAVKTLMFVQPGDDVKLSTVNTGVPPEPAHFNATVVDFFKSGMSEYDSNLVFCDIKYLQKIRGMLDPQPGAPLVVGQSVRFMWQGVLETGTIKKLTGQTGQVLVHADFIDGDKADITLAAADVTPIARNVTSIQIKLKDFRDASEVVEKLEAVFPTDTFAVHTWEQKQGPLLAAVDVESTILNVLLFLIIAVAGFGILAIFFMIVVEKTRDIGILKALGASSRGVMSIFLSYGLGLGLVGSGVGTVLGLLFVSYINEIEKIVTAISGRKVFDERIYYFPEIPTDVSPLMVFWVAAGAITIAVLASILPARRAAGLRPVEALRYE
jgi:lipoprotein-releasing system permease protein